MRSRMFWAACLALAQVQLGCAQSEEPVAAGPLAAEAAAEKAVGRPNIIVVQTDDQTAASLSRARMPNLFAALESGGRLFRSHIATTPLCCPSRATLLTGQYAHNHGVHSNRPGYPHLRDKDNVLPVWLQRAGYRTAHVGKFLHGLQLVDGGRRPPGWDDWVDQSHPRSYFDYELEEHGRRVSYGQGARNYLTRVLNRKAAQIVRRHADSKRPLFLELDHYAPHHSSREDSDLCPAGATPDPADLKGVPTELLPDRPSLDEADLSDKPRFMEGLGRLGPAELKRTAATYRCDLASLRATDRGIGRILRELKRNHALGNTVLIFTSDNGYLYGEHRIAGGKGRPYEPSIRIPLAITGPSLFTGDESSPVGQMTANVDLAPTILDLARAQPCPRRGECRKLDGRSLVPLLRGDGSDWPQDRAVVIENLGSGNLDRIGSTGRSCRWRGLRTSRIAYFEHDLVPHPRSTPGRPRCVAGLELELYDLARDPSQFTSLISARSTGDEQLALARYWGARLEALRRCSGSLPEGSCE